MQLPESGHDPVLLDECLHWLAPSGTDVVFDCTLGRAGHALELGRRLGAGGLLVGLDVDPFNLEFAKSRLAGLTCRVRLFHANFAEVEDVWHEVDRPKVSCMLADLGLSTNQLFDDRYGLSFAQTMPLDMRIDPRIGRSAADLVNTMAERELADVIFQLADERFSRRIARKIVEARAVQPINTTDRLAEIVRSAVPPRGPYGTQREKIDPATRTFLALRMKVNRETENLAALLESAPRVLRSPGAPIGSGAPDRSGGRLGIISFQSTEDRMVKQAFRSAEQTGLVRVLTKKPVTPTDSEIARNPRSRSSKLRVAEKT